MIGTRKSDGSILRTEGEQRLQREVATHAQQQVAHEIVQIRNSLDNPRRRVSRISAFPLEEIIVVCMGTGEEGARMPGTQNRDTIRDSGRGRPKRPAPRKLPSAVIAHR